MDKYGLLAYPNVAAEAVAELAKCRQEDGESPIDYFMKTRALLKICGRTESSYAYEFMSGLKNQEVKKFMTLSYHDNDELDLYEIALHAQQAESKTTAIKGVTKLRTVNSISAVRSEKGVRDRDRGGGGGERGGRNEGGGGGRRGGGGGAGPIRKDRSRPTIHAVQCSEPEFTHWKYKKWSMKQCLDYFQTRVPPGTIVGRCMGCLSKGHKWDGNFGSCVKKKCPFCATSFFAKDGHAVPECPKCPVNKNAIALIVNKKA